MRQDKLRRLTEKAKDFFKNNNCSKHFRLPADLTIRQAQYIAREASRAQPYSTNVVCDSTATPAVLRFIRAEEEGHIFD